MSDNQWDPGKDLGSHTVIYHQCPHGAHYSYECSKCGEEIAVRAEPMQHQLEKLLSEHPYELRDTGPGFKIKCGCGWESLEFDAAHLVYSQWNEHFVGKFSAQPVRAERDAASANNTELEGKLAAVEALAEKWSAEVLSYPSTEQGISARITVNLCRQELRAALAGQGVSAAVPDAPAPTDASGKDGRP
jgi:hypothetical protein